MSLILDGTNGLSDVDGSVGTPAIRGTDSNTGIYFPAADQVAITAGGTQKALFGTGSATIDGLTVGKGSGSQSSNTAVGASALSANTTGNTSTAVGSGALQNNTTGAGNTAVGQAALQTITTANYNDAFGWIVLNVNTSGSSNAGFGNRALSANTTGSNNTGIGVVALSSNTTGSQNTGVGLQALTGVTTGSSNVGIGYNAGSAITTSGDNTCVGYTAGNNITTGATNTCIGRNAIPNAATDSNETVVGGGFPFQGKGSNTGYFGGSSGVYNQANSAVWSTTSDRRLKKNIVDNTDGLNKITSVRVRNFEYRLKEEITELNPSNIIEKTGVQLGVIAQELQEVLPDCVKEESSGVLSVQSDNLNWYMINAIKDLKALVDAQATEITALKAKVGI